MKKEKKIKAHTRRTKSGKTITVKAHTARYDAADELKKAAKKKGAGDELESILSSKKMEALVDAYADKHGLVYEEDGVYSDSKGRNFVLGFINGKVVKRQVNDFLTTNYEETKGKKKKASPVEKEKLPTEPKSSKSEATSLKSNPTKKNSYEQYGFTKEEFAEWYEGTGSKADKRVEKALRKAMGSKAYNDLNDSAADNYKKGGADSFFKKGIKKMQTATNSSAKSGGNKVSSDSVKKYAHHEDISVKEARSELSAMSNKEFVKTKAYFDKQPVPKSEDSKTQLSEANKIYRKVISLKEKLRQAKYVHSGLKRDDPKKLQYAKKIQKLQKNLADTQKAFDSQVMGNLPTHYANRYKEEMSKLPESEWWKLF